ncbi:sulfurtransferase [Arthrobacter sp. I2-34]|uniref:Sulfurtransferase n=1 Tax=Arthrobacter hankyongi TaxID=2904801 RepID=A0ABS9LBB1_9MICC|nr:sulfurtransferase [Arthrobacter hankyongi]MCG2623967.1 sulfurtransferase [Arthrobacter hankyongi]
MGAETGPAAGPVLIDVPTLQERLASGARTLLLDVRWALGDPHGREHYLAGHLPGAVYVDLESQLAAPASAASGRHPLPDPAAFAQAARGWGINDGDLVVAYDATGGLAAARLWWLLRDGGIAGCRLLDGGLGAWQAAGLALEAGDVRPAPGTVRLAPGQWPVLELAEVADFARNGLLLDARAAERYRGESEPVDPRTGHIPGAVSAPTTANLQADGRFLPADRLAERFGRLGAGPGKSRKVAVYCGSGITAAHEIAALAHAGIEAALYPGSWSQWSQHPDLPAATGDEPGNAQSGTIQWHARGGAGSVGS